MRGKKIPVDAIAAALAVVSAALRAEAQAQRSTVPADPDRGSRVRLGIALDSIADRIDSQAVSGKARTT